MESQEKKVEAVIKSPCLNNCCLNDSDICLGCFRTVTEIKQWALVDDVTRQIILENTEKRKNSERE